MTLSLKHFLELPYGWELAGKGWKLHVLRSSIKEKEVLPDLNLKQALADKISCFS